jgi:glycosyltransferase involved in cell wall biosynthesis
MFASETCPPPTFSIVIPARDEELTLPRCLDSIQKALALARTEAEVIVVLNRCTDNTESIAISRGCRITKNESKNLAAIRNAGVSLARGRYLVTIDADSQMSQNMLQRILLCLADETAIGGGVVILPERWSLGILATGMLLLPIALWYGISGGLFFCRREDFAAIGGFDEQLSSVEDIDFAKRLKAHGRRTGRTFRTLLRASIITSCRKFDRFGDWYFVLRPWLTWSLLKGRNQAAADKVWYDFQH